MYFNIYSGFCAPAKRDLLSLATIFSQALRPRNLRIWLKRCHTIALGPEYGTHLETRARLGSCPGSLPDKALR